MLHSMEEETGFEYAISWLEVTGLVCLPPSSLTSLPITHPLYAMPTFALLGGLVSFLCLFVLRQSLTHCVTLAVLELFSVDHC